MNLKPVYSDYKNSLEEKNLYGKIKRIEYYKNSELKKIENFTTFGEIEKTEYFDKKGNIIQTNFIEYDTNQKYIKSISINNLNDSKSVQTVKYDSLKNTSELNVFFNDTIDYKQITSFNKKNLATNIVNVKLNKIVSEYNYEYDFNQKNKLKSTKQKGTDIPTTLTEFKYDSNNKLIETLHVTEATQYIKEATQFVSETKWKDNYIHKQSVYKILPNLEREIFSITEFDKLYNTVYSIEYETSKLSRELKFKYQFDKKGNWINKSVTKREFLTKSNEFIPFWNEIRKINYWE